ncbi:MAG TPA: hypothetical protein VFS35_06805, partial [Terrimicrobiaceae bacterium]|nr:hypothetical protein [Terrimicrobiaceae bacterium]
MIIGLFGEKKTTEALKSTLGFDATSGLACTKALEVLINKHFAVRGQQIRRASLEAQQGKENDAVRWVRQTFGSRLSDEQLFAFIAAAWSFHDWGDVLTLDVGELAEQAQVSEDESRAYLKALSIGFGEVDERLRTGTEEVRLHPFIPIEDGRYGISFPGN